MASNINPDIPRDGEATTKSELRANFLAAKTEIEVLQGTTAAGVPPSTFLTDANLTWYVTTQGTSAVLAVPLTADRTYTFSNVLSVGGLPVTAGTRITFERSADSSGVSEAILANHDGTELIRRAQNQAASIVFDGTDWLLVQDDAAGLNASEITSTQGTVQADIDLLYEQAAEVKGYPNVDVTDGIHGPNGTLTPSPRTSAVYTNATGTLVTLGGTYLNNHDDMMIRAGAAAGPVQVIGEASFPLNGSVEGYVGADDVVADAVFGTPTGNQVTVTSASSAILRYQHGDVLEFSGRGETGNNGLCMVVDTPVSALNSLTIVKRDGTAPAAEASATLTIKKVASIRLLGRAYVRRYGSAIYIEGATDYARDEGERTLTNFLGSVIIYDSDTEGAALDLGEANPDGSLKYPSGSIILVVGALAVTATVPATAVLGYTWSLIQGSAQKITAAVSGDGGITAYPSNSHVITAGLGAQMGIICGNNVDLNTPQVYLNGQLTDTP